MVSTQTVFRFYSKVKKLDSGCWDWLGSKTRTGYGYFHLENRTNKAHRVSWIIHNGAIPRGAFICHHCDNPSCVNPKHLFTGSALDNTRDMISKKRNNFSMGGKHSHPGELHPQTNLTWKVIREIRKKYATGKYNQKELAKKYNLTQTGVSAIVRCETWKE